MSLILLPRGYPLPTITPPVTIATWIGVWGGTNPGDPLYYPQPELDGSLDGWKSSNLAFRLPALEAANFAAFAGGVPYTIMVGSIPTIRIIPMSHPLFPALLCRSAKVQWTGSHTPTNPFPLKNYSDAKVILGFESVPYATTGQTPYLVQRGRAASEQYSLAGRQLFFSNGQPLQADASITVGTNAFSFTVYQAPSVPGAVIENALANPRNSATFFGEAVGSTRFDSYEYEHTQLATGVTTSAFPATQDVYTITYQFTYRSIDWNKFLRPDCVWDTVAIGSSGGTAFGYGSSDLNLLFA